MPRPHTAAVAALAVVALLGVVAVTSHPSVWAVPRDGQADLLEMGTVVLGAFAVAFAGAWIFVLRTAADRQTAWRKAIPGALVAASLIGLVGISTLDLYPAVDPPGVERQDNEGRRGIRLRSDWRGPAVRRPGERAEDAEGILLTSDWARFVRRALLAAAVLGLIVVVALRRAARVQGIRGLSLEAPGGLDAVRRAAAHEAVVVSIDAMLADPDPRTAIIGAYGRLQEELESIEASRFDYEGPFEHLRRVLTVLEVRPEPLRTLIGLFEVARFSERPLSARHRDEALEALRAVASDLAPAGGVDAHGAVVAGREADA